MLPMGWLNEKLFPLKDKVNEIQTFDEAKSMFLTMYDFENPVTRPMALKEFLASS